MNAPVERRHLRSSLSRIGELGRVWACAAVVSFLAVALVYSQFFGQAHMVQNTVLYRGHCRVVQAGTVELYTGEGHGLTSYGENGLVVDKLLVSDRPRVLFLGDSFVQARGVSDRAKFTEIVEREWNARYPEKPIQTLNLGLGGLDMADYVAFGDNIDHFARPDLVFLFIHENDFGSLSELEETTRRLARPAAKPRFSAVLNLVDRMGCYAFYRQLRLRAQAFADNNGPTGRPEESHGPSGIVSREAIAAQVKAIEGIWGERLVIIYYRRIPNLGQDVPERYEDRVLQEIAKQDIPVIELYEPLLEAFQARRPPTGFDNSYLGEGHLNEHGHRLVANQVLAFLEASDGIL